MPMTNDEIVDLVLSELYAHVTNYGTSLKSILDKRKIKSDSNQRELILNRILYYKVAKLSSQQPTIPEDYLEITQSGQVIYEAGGWIKHAKRKEMLDALNEQKIINEATL